MAEQWLIVDQQRPSATFTHHNAPHKSHFPLCRCRFLRGCRCFRRRLCGCGVFCGFPRMLAAGCSLIDVHCVVITLLHGRLPNGQLVSILHIAVRLTALSFPLPLPLGAAFFVMGALIGSSKKSLPSSPSPSSLKCRPLNPFRESLTSPGPVLDVSWSLHFVSVCAMEHLSGYVPLRACGFLRSCELSDA
jgi:hypothetical protein